MRLLLKLISLTTLTLSFNSFGMEKTPKASSMGMHEKHMRCLEEKSEKECNDMMMQNCKMNKDMCKQMMQDIDEMDMHKKMNKEK